MRASGNAHLRSLDLSTSSIRSGEQFDYWRSLFAHVNELSPVDTDAAKGGFSASARIFNLGTIVAVKLSSPGIYIDHSHDFIRSNGLDHRLVSLFHAGSAALSTGSQDYAIHEGHTAIVDLSRPFRIRTEGAYRRTNFHIPSAFIPTSSSDIDVLDLVKRQGSLQKLLVSYLHSLSDIIEDLTVAEAKHIADATRAMFLACFAPTPDHLRQAGPVLRATAAERARLYIQKNLTNPKLGVEELRIFLGVSRATLYRIFAPLGGVDKYVRQQKLSACHQALMKGDAHSIKQVWAKYCFTSASDFSRAFKANFGYGPRDIFLLATREENAQLPTINPIAQTEFRHWISTLQEIYR